MRVVPPPSSVITPPPSIVVAPFVESSFSDVIGIVAAPPQLNVMIPPVAIADVSAASVHDAAVPVPTTVVGLDVSTGVIGGVHVGGGGAPSPRTIGPESSGLTGMDPSSLPPVGPDG